MSAPIPFVRMAYIARPLRCIGRGGFVSRRDRNQVAGNCAQLAWVRNSEGKVKSIPSYSSEEGVWGRGASLREAASPPDLSIPSCIRIDKKKKP